MGRPVTLFTGQFADLTLEVIAEKASKWGYDGIELPCWGDHFNVQKALAETGYCKGRHELLGKYGLKTWAISNHLTGQLVLDHNDARTDDWVPASVRGDAKKKTDWAIQEMKDSARAAQKLGVKVVNGFTGSSIWHLLYSFPPVSDAMIDEGFKLFADRWNPILDVFKECGVKFALEVHPTEIAFDIYTAQRSPGGASNIGPSLGLTSTRAICSGSSSTRWNSSGGSPTGFITFTSRMRPAHSTGGPGSWPSRLLRISAILAPGLGFPFARTGAGQLRRNCPGIRTRSAHEAAASPSNGKIVAWIVRIRRGRGRPIREGKDGLQVSGATL